MLHKKHLYVIVSISWLVISYTLPFILDKETISALAQEDGFQENATAVWFLLAGLLFLFQFFRDRQGSNFYVKKTKRNIFFLLLGVLFIFGFGEEISWGQRIFNIQTPERLKEINLQHEINLHNLTFFQGDQPSATEKTFHKGMLTIGRLFSIFWFSYCVLVPLLAKVSTRFKKIVNTTNLPLVPLSIGLLFLLNHIAAKAIRTITDYDLTRYITETRESLFAFLFFIVALWFVNNNTSHKEGTQTC